MKRFVAVAALGMGLAAASLASAAPVELETFDSPNNFPGSPSAPFTLDAIYASWGAPFATLTPNPDRFTIRSHDYGSAYKYLGGEFDAAGNDTVQLQVTVTEGVAGCLVDLVDANNNGQAYRFYGLVPGGGTNGGNDYTLTMPISSGAYFTGTGVLDTTKISQMNLEIDPGPNPNPGQTAPFYTASFNDLSLVSSVPEPAGLAICAFAGFFAARRARRRV